MFDFSSVLEQDEKIIKELKPEAGQGDKSIGGELFVIFFCIFVGAILVASLVYKIGDGADGISFTYIGIFAGLLLFLVICLYNILYKFIFKAKKVKNLLYCITNQRVMIYQIKQDKLEWGYIYTLNKIEIQNKKDNYGDVFLYKELVSEEEVPQRLQNHDDHNLLSINLESIYKPNEIKQLIIDLQSEYKRIGEM